MKVTPDTNILLRATMQDDPEQSPRAADTLRSATVIALTTHALCEPAWVLARGHKVPSAEIARVLRRLLADDNVVADRSAVQAGLAFLDAGGDFADGVIAQAGLALSGETFVSFDRRAVAIAASLGLSAIVP